MILLLACSDPPEQLAVELPSAYAYEAGTQDDAVDLVELQADAQAVLDDLRVYNAGPIIDAWYDAHTYAGRDCPLETISETAENGYVVYFDGECVAADRYWFKGPMTTYDFEDNRLEAFEVYDLRPYLEGDSAWTGQAIKGQTDVYDAESTLDFNCSCTATIASSLADPNAPAWFSYTDGPSHWTAPTADTAAWMNNGITSNIFMWFSTTASDSRWQAVVNGSVTGVGATYGNIALDIRLAGSQLEQGVLCDPGLTFSVEARRSSTGARTRMEFETAAGACSACAVVGDGEVCLDLTNALDWEGAPW